MKKLHLPIMIDTDEDGYFIVSCPTIKGCRSYGETIDEALDNIKEVIEMCLEEQEVEPLNKFIGLRELEILQLAPEKARKLLRGSGKGETTTEKLLKARANI